MLYEKAWKATTMGTKCGPADRRAAESLKRSLRSLLILRYASICAAAWGFAWGAGVLVLRAATSMPRAPLAWGALGFVPALFIGWRTGLRRTPSADRLWAAVDRRNRAGGLVMSALETDLGGWRIGPLQTVPARWRAGRFAALFAASVAFVCVAFLLPASMSHHPGQKARLDVNRETEKLMDQVELLKEEKILDPRKADELAQHLERIREEAEGKDPAKAWEALDHLAQDSRNKAEDAAEERAGLGQKMAAAETLAEALAEAGEQMAPEALAEAMSALAELVSEAAEGSERLAEGLPESLLDAAKQGALTPEEMKELAERLKGLREELREGLANLCEAGLICPETMSELLSRCEGGDPAALAEFLAAEAGDGAGMGEGASESLRELLAAMPGRGGITRNGGGVPMTFGEETQKAGARFNPLALPPGSLESVRDSGLLGVSAVAPEVLEHEGPAPGALGEAEASGGAAEKATILPRHRGAVTRYFERE